MQAITCSTDVWISSSLSMFLSLAVPSLHHVWRSQCFPRSPHPPLYLSTHLLRLCESVALRGKSFILLETCHWPWYDGSGNKSISGNINRIFTSFSPTTFDRVFITDHAEGGLCVCWRESSPLRWNSWEQEIGRLTLHLPRVRAPPHSPQRPPL